MKRKTFATMVAVVALMAGTTGAASAAGGESPDICFSAATCKMLM
ncbi:hypothetical protein [Ornithinimicrobium faecis]|nr:hypothetical protein [Ornithinimicrobium sp. HY1793]